MRKKLSALLIIGSLGALCAGLCACSHETMIDGYFKDGNVISVTFDASGGSIAGSDNVKIVDMFNPDKYAADADGNVKIKLRTPADESRPTVGVSHIRVTRSGYSLVGWYKTRNLVKDDKENVLDEDGNKLHVGDDGFYYLRSEDDEGNTVDVKAIPAYTYSAPWDFDKDRVEFNKNEDESLDMTLYAAWVKNFTFEYYYEAEAENEWTLFGTTSFNCMTASEEDKKVYVPVWSGDTGRMDHSNGSYSFPSVDNMTFKAAYSDEACTAGQEITRANPLTHVGTVDFETATPIGSVQKVYVKFDEGNRYRISTAKQLSAINDLRGIYTILSDTLDFGEENASWPTSFPAGEFKGSIGGEDGKAVAFKGVSATYSRDTAPVDGLFGGLFGKIGSGATIKNVTFENAVLAIDKATSRYGGSFGLFAGEIDKDASVENIKIGGELRLKEMSVTGGTDGLEFNLTANGTKRESVTNTGIRIVICYAATYQQQYEFYIDPAEGKTTVNEETGAITITTFVISNQTINERMKDKENYIVYGGDQNE